MVDQSRMEQLRKNSAINTGYLSYRAVYWIIKIAVHMAYPLKLLNKFLKDEYLLRYYQKDIPKEQKLTTTKSRAVGILSAVVLTAAYCFCITAIANGAGVSTYIDRSVFLKRAFWELDPSHLGNVINLNYLYAVAMLPLFAFAMDWWFYFAQSSSYKKVEKGLAEISGSVKEEDKTMKSPWFYPHRLVVLELTGITGKELLSKESMWLTMDFSPSSFLTQFGKGNRWIFLNAPTKDLTSTIFYNRYETWNDEILADEDAVGSHYLGEYVNKNGHLWAPAYDDFSLLFLGTSGSGKTEAMKMWLSAFLIKNPETRLVISDLKAGSDWNVFAPYTENGKIITSIEETLLALTYLDPIFLHREEMMRRHGVKNIRGWSDEEKDKYPPILLIIDEMPQLSKPLRFDYDAKKEGTPANVLFKMLTKGRSFGLWFVGGTQFLGSEYVPVEVIKNIQKIICFRANAGDALRSTNSELPTLLGNSKRHKDGTLEQQRGYAYASNKEDFVRFLFMPDYFIAHELLKYKVPSIKGKFQSRLPAPGLDQDIQKKIDKVDGKIKKLPTRIINELNERKLNLPPFEKSWDLIEKEIAENSPLDIKTPLGPLWKIANPESSMDPGYEAVEDFRERAIDIMLSEEKKDS